MLLAGIAPTLKEVGPGQDMLSNLGPVGLLDDALGEKACVTA